MLFFICVPRYTNAQTPSNIVDLQQPDKARLEWFTFDAVNMLREHKKLPNLVWDDVLYRAAIDHAQYLLSEKKISHFQTIKGKKTPAERVKIHGGLAYTIVGENIVEITLGGLASSNGLTLSTATYEAAAATMATLWKNSPGHYKNIISKNYNCTALAVAYDSTRQRCIAVQVFGYTNTPSTTAKFPDYSDHLLDLPNSTLPYGLQPYTSKKQKATDGFQKMYIDRGYITSTYKDAKKIFKGRRSGITQEFIPLSQFDSASTEFSMVPNRRNALFELNGKLTKPIYRKKLLKYCRQHTPPTYYIETSLIRCFRKKPHYFFYPLQPNGPEIEFNLFLIKNKHLQAYRSYIVVPSKLLETSYPPVTYIKPFKLQSVPDKYRTYNTYDTLHLRLYYTSGQTNLDSSKQIEIAKSFNAIKGKITSVQIAAFASIEGEKAGNDLLAKSRMDNFMLLVKPYLDTITIQPKIIKQEQWRLFYKQLEGTRLQFVKKMKPDEIRAYVNQHTSDTLLSYFLNQQRYLDVALTYRQEFKEKIKTKTSVEIYDSLKTEFYKYEKPKQELVNALEKAQFSVYLEWSLLDSTALQACVLRIPREEKYPIFTYNELVFKYTVQGSISDKTFYDSIHVFGNSKYFPAKSKNDLIYNNLVLIYKHFATYGDLNELMNYEAINNEAYRKSEFFLKKNKKGKSSNPNKLYQTEYFALKELPAFIALGKRVKAPDFHEDELWKYYYVYTIHSLYNFIPMHPEINKMLPGIKKYYHPNDAILTDSQCLELAYFYTAIDKYAVAKALIEPIATRTNPNIEALKLYVTLRYEDFEDDHEYIKYLTGEYSRLGKTEWCDLWFNPNYLNFLLLEDLRLKEFYNCNCDK